MAGHARSVESILFEAAEIPHEDRRREFVESACNGDAALRCAVERLLAAHLQAGSFLTPPAELSATLAVNPLTERPGSVIGPYKLLEQIGEGGMGVVYMAEQQHPVRRKVALKIIKPGMDTRQVIARFEAERQALALMDHPNIAHVLDAGTTDSGRPYFVMELVRGVAITEYCDKNKLTTQERLGLFVDVCRAVQHAHQKGIIHRDIKPSNVLVTLHDGIPVPKIIDFGVAKATNQQLTERTLFTAFAQMVGTPLYMSPEQAEMSGLDVDTRSDIYSLGVLLYELLTGTTPFDRKRIHSAARDEVRRIIREEEPSKPSTKVSTLGERLAIISAQRRIEPKRLSQLLRGELDWIVMKTLEKDRTRRYDTASALAADVQRYLAGETVQACPPSASYKLRKMMRRHKRAVVVACSFVLVLLASSAIAWGLYLQAAIARNQLATASANLRKERDNAIDLRKKAQDSKADAEHAAAELGKKAEELRRQLYGYNILKADRGIRERDLQGLRQILESCPEDLRHWEWRRLRFLSDQSWKSIDAPGVQTFLGEVSPDGRAVALAATDGQVHVFDVPRGVELWKRKTKNDLAVRAKFSPDGRQIVTCGFVGAFERPERGVVETWDARTGQRLWSFEAPGEAVGDVAFSPDGRRLWAVSARLPSLGGLVRVWDAGSQELLWETTREGIGFAGLAIGPSGDFAILFGGNPKDRIGELRRWSFAPDSRGDLEATEVWRISTGFVQLPILALDREGARLAVASAGALQLRDAVTGDLVDSLAANLLREPGPQGPESIAICSAAFDPTGKKVVFGRTNSELIFWNTAAKHEATSLWGHTGAVGVAGFTPDGEQIISAGNDAIIIWAPEPPPPVLTLRAHEKTVKGVAFTSDGRTLISVGFDSQAYWWDTHTGQLVRTVARDDEILYSLARSEDGRQIALGSHRAVILRDSDSGRLRRQLPKFEPAWCVVFSPDGSRVAAGGHSGRAACWDTATGEEATTLEFPPKAGYLDGLAFSRDGSRLIGVFHGGGLLVWDAASGKVLRELRPLMEEAGAKCRGVVCSPQRPLLAAGIGANVEIWDLDKARQVHVLRGHRAEVNALAYSPDGDRLFSGDTSGIVKVWNTLTGEQLLSFQAHEGTEAAVQSLAVSPDGKQLATAGNDLAIRLWDTERLSPETVHKRRLTEKAMQIVLQRRTQLGCIRSVAASLRVDKPADPAVARIALEIAGAMEETASLRRVHTAQAIQRGDWREAGEELAIAILDRFEADRDAPESLGMLPPGVWWNRTNLEFAAPEKWSAWGVSLPQVAEALGPAVEIYPREHEVVYVRGMVNARLGRWKEAADDMARAVELVPERSELWHEYAYRLGFLYAWIGDWDHYDALCRKMLADFGQSTNPQLADRTAKLCLFSEHIAVDAERAAALADRGLRESPPDWLMPWVHMAKGIADYRRRRHQEAATALESAAQALAGGSQSGLAGSLFYLAMARQQLGRAESARQAYDAGAKVLGALPGLESNDVPAWNDIIVAEMARREAAALLGIVAGQEVGASKSNQETKP